ncbi:aldo/keto reductase [Spongorhabdus nitratireducens]
MQSIPLQDHLPHASHLVFGCMNLGGGWNHDPVTTADISQAHSLIDITLEAGINLFDHADIYTFGKAEQVFGKILGSHPALREKMLLQSKCGIRFEDSQGPKRYDLSRNWIISSVDNILTRLQTEYLDLLLLHRPDPLMEPEEIAEAFTILSKTGKVRHFGVSNMNAQQIRFLQSANDIPLVTNQLNLGLSALDWLEEGVLVNHPEGSGASFTSGTLEYCQQNRIQLQAWGSLSQGIFSGRPTGDYSSAVQQTARLAKQLAAEMEVSSEAIVLSWLMRHPARIQPVIGTTHPDRLKACAEASRIELSREQWYQLYAAARGRELP